MNRGWSGAWNLLAVENKLWTLRLTLAGQSARVEKRRDLDSGNGVAERERTRLGLPCRDAGLPLGNLASQLLANYYRSDMDHMIKERLQIKHYIRCMDDFTLLHHDRAYLKR